MNIDSDPKFEISSRLLECSICLDIYNKPRILLCGHSLCEVCIIGLISSRDTSIKNEKLSVKCPECEKNSFISKVSDLPINYVLKSITDPNHKIPELSKSLPEKQSIWDTGIKSDSNESDIPIDIFVFDNGNNESTIEPISRISRNERPREIGYCFNLLNTGRFSAPY